MSSLPHSPRVDSRVGYVAGFANHYSTEAVLGALPIGRNSPQVPPFGLYAEQLSATAFTAPRAENRRSWLYRLRPSAQHPPFALCEPRKPLAFAPTSAPLTPNRLRWDPPLAPTGSVDFVDSWAPYAGNGSPELGSGLGIYMYCANTSMRNRAFFSADGELLIVPQQGGLRVVTELGTMIVGPGEIVVIPRGVRMRIELTSDVAIGYVGENYGALFRLPELGPLGSNGLANVRDFLTPVAAFEDVEVATELVQKFHGHLWSCTLDHSPFDVVAWHGNLAPYKYNLADFNTIGTVSFDHPDPSIFTVLTSPSDTPGTANCDFVIFPPRWMVAENTFRPPWFHRNVMSEFMGLIHGEYDAKKGGFLPGGASLHNCMSAHGPDQASHARASTAALAPHKIEHTMAFMFESRHVLAPAPAALASPLLQPHYDACWRNFPKANVR
jgi:homogentisate 1,2-dioxygenase